MKIAVVGAGIAGLTAAHLLSREHEVSVFEANARLGGHTHTHHIDIAGQAYRVDTGFIVFNRLNYPLFSKLLDSLGVAGQPSEMSFSVRDEGNGLQYKAHTLNSLFCQRRNLIRPSFVRMIREIRRFYREAPRLLSEGDDEQTTGDYLQRRNYSRAFIAQHLVPMASALWSAPPAQILDFPIRYMVKFFANHRMLQFSERPMWQTIRGGSSNYIEPLCRPFANRIHLNRAIRQLRRENNGVVLRTSDNQQLRFDKAVVASHSDQALRLLADPSQSERDVLGAIDYQPNEVTLHTDSTLLPARNAWAAWNSLVPADPTAPCSVTYCMNILQSLHCPLPLCVTLNNRDRIDPAKVLAQTRYHHPVYTREAVKAQQDKGLIDGVKHTYFCGAYWGFGFHEDGVRSAANVAKQFGIEL